MEFSQMCVCVSCAFTMLSDIDEELLMRTSPTNVRHETNIQSLGQEDPLEEGMATHCSILAWRIPWTEEHGGLWSMRSHRVEHNWSDLAWQGIYKWSGKDTFTPVINTHAWFSNKSSFPSKDKLYLPWRLLSFFRKLIHLTNGLVEMFLLYLYFKIIIIVI